MIDTYSYVWQYPSWKEHSPNLIHMTRLALRMFAILAACISLPVSAQISFASRSCWQIDKSLCQTYFYGPVNTDTTRIVTITGTAKLWLAEHGAIWNVDSCRIHFTDATPEAIRANDAIKSVIDDRGTIDIFTYTRADFDSSATYECAPLPGCRTSDAPETTYLVIRTKRSTLTVRNINSWDRVVLVTAMRE